MGQNIVHVSLPQLIIIVLLKIKKSNHHIQFNKHNNLQNKMIEQTYHEMLSTVINELLRPLFGGLDSARASPQTAPSGSAHVQET